MTEELPVFSLRFVAVFNSFYIFLNEIRKIFLLLKGCFQFICTSIKLW